MPLLHVVGGEVRHMGGWRRDQPDHRDLRLGAAFGVTPQSKGFVVADRANLRPIMPPVYDQGAVGWCTGFGWCTAIEALRAKLGLPYVRFSRSFFYAGERERVMHTPLSEDSGATIRDGAKFFNLYGCCHEDTWPTDGDRFMVAPTEEAYVEAATHKSVRYYRLDDIDWMRACLTIGYPVVFGFSVPASFMQTGPDGQAHYPKDNEPFVGGHCVVAYGHDDGHDNGDGTIGAFLCRNSWGENFGLGGDFWLPYRYFTDWLATDAWAVHEEAV